MVVIIPDVHVDRERRVQDVSKESLDWTMKNIRCSSIIGAFAQDEDNLC